MGSKSVPVPKTNGLQSEGPTESYQKYECFSLGYFFFGGNVIFVKFFHDFFNSLYNN